MNRRLFTVAVIAYNNYKYIFETLDSILSQDYPCIELLVSNDASSDFNTQAVIDYIVENKGENILSYSVWQQEANLGTVRNAEFCRKNARGDAFYLIAADDILADVQVISEFAKAMEERTDKFGVFSGHVRMCDENLENPRYNWTTTAEMNLIREGNSSKIFSRLSNRTLIPTTGTCYRASLLESIGGFDTSYRLIEDAPTYLRLARFGAGFCWVDGLTAALHRDGGTCHSKVDYKKPSYRMYTEDRMRIFKQEVFPYLARIRGEDMVPMLRLWYSARSNYEKSHSCCLPHRILIRLRHATGFVLLFALCNKKDCGALKFKLIAYARVMKRHFRLYLSRCLNFFCKKNKK